MSRTAYKLRHSNARGVLHLHISGDQPEAGELKQHVEGMQGRNTAHSAHPVFNPAVSKAQYRAMQAAAHGKSTLGIPKAVGSDYVDATRNPKKLPARKR